MPGRHRPPPPARQNANGGEKKRERGTRAASCRGLLSSCRAVENTVHFQRRSEALDLTADSAPFSPISSQRRLNGVRKRRAHGPQKRRARHKGTEHKEEALPHTHRPTQHRTNTDKQTSKDGVPPARGVPRRADRRAVRGQDHGAVGAAHAAHRPRAARGDGPGERDDGLRQQRRLLAGLGHRARAPPRAAAGAPPCCTPRAANKTLRSSIRRCQLDAPHAICGRCER